MALKFFDEAATEDESEAARLSAKMETWLFRENIYSGENLMNFINNKRFFNLKMPKQQRLAIVSRLARKLESYQMLIFQL